MSHDDLWNVEVQKIETKPKFPHFFENDETSLKLRVRGTVRDSPFFPASPYRPALVKCFHEGPQRAGENPGNSFFKKIKKIKIKYSDHVNMSAGMASERQSCRTVWFSRWPCALVGGWLPFWFCFCFLKDLFWWRTRFNGGPSERWRQTRRAGWEEERICTAQTRPETEESGARQNSLLNRHGQ